MVEITQDHDITRKQFPSCLLSFVCSISLHNTASFEGSNASLSLMPYAEQKSQEIKHL
jgi:hypothetical protein